MLQSILNSTAIVVVFVILILLEHDSPHQPAGCPTTSKQLKLGKTLLWENIETVQGNPASMRQTPYLLH